MSIVDQSISIFIREEPGSLPTHEQLQLLGYVGLVRFDPAPITLTGTAPAVHTIGANSIDNQESFDAEPVTVASGAVEFVWDNNVLGARTFTGSGAQHAIPVTNGGLTATGDWDYQSYNSIGTTKLIAPGSKYVWEMDLNNMQTSYDLAAPCLFTANHPIDVTSAENSFILRWAHVTNGFASHNPFIDEYLPNNQRLSETQLNVHGPLAQTGTTRVAVQVDATTWQARVIWENGGAQPWIDLTTIIPAARLAEGLHVGVYFRGDYNNGGRPSADLKRDYNEFTRIDPATADFSGYTDLLDQPLPGASSALNDTFTDTNGTELHLHTADSGQSWSKMTHAGAGSRQVYIQNNQIEISDSGNTGYQVSDAAFDWDSGNIVVKYDYTQINGSTGAIWSTFGSNINRTSPYYFCWQSNDGRARFYESDGAGLTQIGAEITGFSPSEGSPDSVEWIVNWTANTVEFKYGGVSQGTIDISTRTENIATLNTTFSIIVQGTTGGLDFKVDNMTVEIV